MSGPSRSGLRTLLGNTLGGGLFVIGHIPEEPDEFPKAWLQPGFTPKPPPPPPPPKPKPPKKKKNETAGGAGGPEEYVFCPPEITCNKQAIRERQLREIFERAAKPEAPIEVWRPKVEEPPVEKTSEAIEVPPVVPSVVIVEVPVIVEVIKETIVYVPVPAESVPVPVEVAALPIQFVPPKPVVPAFRYLTLSYFWPHLLVGTTVAAAIVVTTNVLEKPRTLGRRRRRLT